MSNHFETIFKYDMSISENWLLNCKYREISPSKEVTQYWKWSLQSLLTPKFIMWALSTLTIRTGKSKVRKQRYTYTLYLETVLNFYARSSHLITLSDLHYQPDWKRTQYYDILQRNAARVHLFTDEKSKCCHLYWQLASCTIWEQRSVSYETLLAIYSTFLSPWYKQLTFYCCPENLSCIECNVFVILRAYVFELKIYIPVGTVGQCGNTRETLSFMYFR